MIKIIANFSQLVNICFCSFFNNSGWHFASSFLCQALVFLLTHPTAPPPTSIHRYIATAFALYIAYNYNKAVKGTARGYQKIMGFSGGADQGRNARL